jgi:hypothetical protein
VAEWTVTSLASNSSTTYKVTFKPVVPGTVSVSSTVWSPTVDPNYSNNVSVASVPILS